jgi:predicted nucleotidyltransferase
MNFADSLKPLDSIFKKLQIRYAIIGGYAVAAWGEERATRDIDLLCGAANSNSILRALEENGLRFEHRMGDYDDPISEVIRIDMDIVSSPYEIDLLIGIRDAPPGILDRARIVNFDDLAIPVASPEDMVILKVLGGSARDLEDARSIVHIQGKRLDLILMTRLCPERLQGILKELTAI